MSPFSKKKVYGDEAYRKKEGRFSITDLLLAIAIAGAASVIAVPSFKQWSRSYTLQSAAMDLYAHMQTQKRVLLKKIGRGL